METLDRGVAKLPRSRLRSAVGPYISLQPGIESWLTNQHRPQLTEGRKQLH